MHICPDVFRGARKKKKEKKRKTISIKDNVGNNYEHLKREISTLTKSKETKYRVSHEAIPNRCVLSMLLKMSRDYV